MKKVKKSLIGLIVVMTASMLCFSACGGEASSAGETEVQKPPSAGSEDGVDLDLTRMSSTVVYAEVYNMMTSPEFYVGKRIKMRGVFDVYEDIASDKLYYACVIADATACCAQGIEFNRDGVFSFPEDYPEIGTEITVTGTFEIYQDGESQYCHVTKATMET